MKPNDSLREIEKRAYRSTFQDGLYDIFFGGAFLILASIPLLSYAGIPTLFGYMAGVILVLIVVLGKRHITIPRLGMVEFGSGRKSKRLWLLLACAAFFFLASPLIIMMPGNGLGGEMSQRVGLPIILALGVGPLLVATAYFLDYPRMYIYAAVLFAGMPHSAMMYDFIGWPLNTVLSFGFPGLIILGYGLVLLSRFMAKYPIPSPEVNHAGR